MENNNNYNQNFENQVPVEPVAPQEYIPQPQAPDYTQPVEAQPQAPVYAQPVQPEPVYNGVPQGDVPPMPAVEPKKQTNGLSIASLVTGILSVTCCCGNIVGIFLSIAAIVLGAMSKKQQSENNTMAVIGIVLGAIGIVLAIVGIIIGASAGLLAGIAESMNSASYYSYY